MFRLSPWVFFFGNFGIVVILRECRVGFQPRHSSALGILSHSHEEFLIPMKAFSDSAEEFLIPTKVSESQILLTTFLQSSDWTASAKDFEPFPADEGFGITNSFNDIPPRWGF